ncbi:MAG: CotH kinase family protein [Planctomycetales bacterium]|nr:CotH kinase family protein [Planctomycetales bacterium]
MLRSLLMGVCLAVWLSPAGSGSLYAAKAKVAKPKFSQQRGICDGSFQLELSSSESSGVIHYTIDGSVPDEQNGQRYSRPIMIDKTTVVRAVVSKSRQEHSAVATHTYLFPAQVWKQPAEPKGYIRSAISVRHGPARPQEFDWAMDPELLASDKEREELLAGLTDLPSLAVTLAVDDFNYLYMNHRGRGVDFERPASLELIYPAKSAYSSFDGFQIDCGIRMHGGLAIDQARKKSFRVLFKKTYGAGKLEYPVFESAANNAASATQRFDSLVLRAGGNGNWSKDIAWKHEPGMYLRDTLVRDSQIAMSGFGSRSTFVHLYLNGLYFGIFNIAERPDNKFMAAYFGGEPKDFYSVNHNGSVDGDSARWDNAQTTKALHELVDVEAYCDYIILNWATGMGDWPWNNWYAGAREIPAGPFYFFAWDAEHAFWTNSGYLYSNPNGWANPVFMNTDEDSFRTRNPTVEIWRALASDPEFKIVFADRVHKHLLGNGELTNEKLGPRFRRLVSQLDKAMVAESCRWGDAAWGREDQPHTRDHDFRGNCQKVARLIENNSSLFIADLRAHGLYPTIEAPELTEAAGVQNTSSPLKLQFRDSSNQSQQIYYTVDGTDPRLPGGTLNPKAAKWSAASSEIEFSRAVRIRARAKQGRQWSSLFDRTFYDDRNGVPLRFTEIMYHPQEDTDDQSLEFIELKNTSNVAIDVAGFHFDGVEYLFPPDKPIAPEQVNVLIPNDDPDRFRKKYPAVEVYGTYRKHLANEGERIAVIDAGEHVIAEVEYGVSGDWPSDAGGSGKSIHCHDVDRATEPASWKSSLPSPGTAPSSPN